MRLTKFLILIAIIAVMTLSYSLIIYLVDHLKSSKDVNKETMKYAEELVHEYLTKGYKPIERRSIPLKGKGIWIWGTTLMKLGVNKTLKLCKELGIKHIFLLVKGISGRVVYENIKKLLPEAHREGIYVHAWIVCFADRSKSNASPDSLEYRKYLLKIIVNFLTLNASNNYIDGIHLDYIRYSGFASEKWEYISSFVKAVRYLVNHLAPGVILSIASKAEKYDSMNDLLESALFYGQNYTDLAKYVDLFCPMTYYLDYGVSPEQVGLAAYWVKKITKKPVFAGIQTHPSENPATLGKIPTAKDIEIMLKACLKYKIDGAVFYALHTIIKHYNEYKPVISKYYNDS